MVKNGNFPLLLTSTGQGWEFNISIVSYRQINWQIYPPELTSSGQGWHLADQLADLPPRYTYAVDKNGNLTFLLSHIDRSTGRSTSPELTSSDQGWPLADPPARTDI